MELDRRQAILSVAMALVARPALAKPERIESALAECHRLTRSLIERARRASTTTNRADIDAIERLIRRTAGASGGRPVIKWLASPADAFDHLRKLNSSELGTELAALWRVRRSCPPCNEDAFERSLRVRQLASEMRGERSQASHVDARGLDPGVLDQRAERMADRTTDHASDASGG